MIVEVQKHKRAIDYIMCYYYCVAMQPARPMKGSVRRAEMFRLLTDDSEVCHCNHTHIVTHSELCYEHDYLMHAK